ncbi:GDYXXLXY domain-containing protein [Flavobacterium rhizosphaerae]|uniref:GDYXXLXY domain-containing protein n=1 Tax=Flavobacterium rhizosphaerae TaxID=3163298 RepID=A0ABW8YYA1_9FLAO
MKTKYIIITLAATLLAQLFVPLKMVYDNEITVTQGKIFRFRTKPVDPNDPFRGKYISLDYEADTIAALPGVWEQGEKAYAMLEHDAEGFARISSLVHDRPDNDTDYIQVTLSYNINGTQYFDLPFDRFYMEESKAPKAETAYREYNNRQSRVLPAYALVAVSHGNAVLKDVIIGGKPIKEYLEYDEK